MEEGLNVGGHAAAKWDLRKWGGSWALTQMEAKMAALPPQM